MRLRSCSAATAILLTLFLSRSAAAVQQDTDFALVDRMVVATTIYAAVQQYFAHWEGAPRQDVEAAYREYLGEALGARDRAGFDLATLRFVGALRNGHSQYVDNQLDRRPLKFRLLEVEGEWVVVGSRESRLPRGTIVRTINGTPAHEFLRRLAAYVSASNDRLALTHVFSNPGLFAESITLGLANGNAVVVDRSVEGDIAPTQVPTASEGRWVRDSDIAYVRIPSFGDPAYERSAIELVRGFESAQSLIVDVRGNGGGTTPRQLIDALMDRPWRTWQERTPQRVALFEAQGMPPTELLRDSRTQPVAPAAYRGRLFILVDRFCGSACEDFVMPFKDAGRGLVIGETTQGSSGNPFRTDLGYGMSLSIGAVRYSFPTGDPFEGVGIAPDVVVDRRIADLVSGRDAVFERANELAVSR